MMQGRLLSRLHRVFNPTPDAVLALRLRASGGLRWEVAGDTLTVMRPDQADLVVPLAGKTIVQVRSELEASGVTIAFFEPDLGSLGALALLPGSGDQDTSNGDHLRAYTSILWAWTDTVGRALDRAKADIGEMLRQLVIRHSDGEWTDLWGSYFGLLRRQNESDARFADRIIFEPRRPRSNPLAIAANIKRETGATVTVREPWREMLIIGVSKLGGTDRIPNNEEFSYHRAQLVSKIFEHDWAPMVAEAEADRPAGTLFLPPITHAPAFEASIGLGHAVVMSCHTLSVWHVRDYEAQIISDNLIVSGSAGRLQPEFTFAFDLPWEGRWDERVWIDN